MRPFVLVFSAVLLLAFAGRNDIAFAQSDKTITVPGVFDIGEIVVKNVPALKSAADTLGGGRSASRRRFKRVFRRRRLR
jgi:hypothetical protein